MEPQINDKYNTAIFAGGCFWCTEHKLEGIKGVTSVTSGYTGGHTENPTYKEVITKNTGHLEAVKVEFDNKIISYKKLLDFFWETIDPTDENGQFADKADQYKTAIIYLNNEQKQIAEQSKQELENSEIYSEPIATKILEYKNFYNAEQYHQQYSLKNPQSYNAYANSPGKVEYFESIKKIKETIK